MPSANGAPAVQGVEKSAGPRSATMAPVAVAAVSGSKLGTMEKPKPAGPLGSPEKATGPTAASPAVNGRAGGVVPSAANMVVLARWNPSHAPSGDQTARPTPLISSVFSGN